MRKQIIFATGNKDKMREIREIMADVDVEVLSMKEAGIKGIKFHPEYQHFYADEERMKPIYRKISQLGLLTLFHAGQDIAENDVPQGIGKENTGHQ